MIYDFNSLFLTDGYKTGHHLMYPTGTEVVYSNLTPRNNKYAPPGCTHLLNIGTQKLFRSIVEHFDMFFFSKNKDEVCQEMKRELSMYLNDDYDVTHFEQLHDLGYLPIRVKALPEGHLVPMRVPVFTIVNTQPVNGAIFHWITNYLETILSSEGWIPSTSATVALQYRRIIKAGLDKTNPEAAGFELWQGHDFSMRGMALGAAINSGIGHAMVFHGSDTLPVIPTMRKYYDAEGFVIGSVNATEHSVMCAGGMEDEIETFRELLRKYPTEILSIVSDTWDLWNVCTHILPALKPTIVRRGTYNLAKSGNRLRPVEEYDEDWNLVRSYFILMNKDGVPAAEISDEAVKHAIASGEINFVPGKVVIRPDSGDPVDIVCGKTRKMSMRDSRYDAECKGVVELLWDVFGGTISSTGYKVLDEHIGCIYGDSINIDRCTRIIDRLAAKGFASTNCVFGIGSFTYQFVTRDTYGFAVKATWCKVNGEERRIFKDPVTDDGTKKSAKGLLSVVDTASGGYELINDCTKEEEAIGCLQVILDNGEFHNQVSLETVRERINKLIA